MAETSKVITTGIKLQGETGKELENQQKTIWSVYLITFHQNVAK